MPYRCQKCMNTFKTLSLYNRHAVDCKHVKSEQGSSSQGVQGRTIQGQGGSGVVIKRSYGDTGIGQSNQDNKRINAKIEFKSIGGGGNNKNDEITILNKNSPKREGIIKREIKPMHTVVETRKPFTVINNFNAGPRLFRCTECDAAFDTKTNLEVHAREGHKDRFCDECEDDFSWPDESHDCYYTRYKLRYISGDIVPAF